MKNLYKQILLDDKIIKRYNDVNKKINFVIDHGILHIEHVLKYINMICDELKIDEHTRDLALIAGVLHDVGRLECWKGHAEESAKFAKEYLKGKLNAEDLEIVLDAISHHERSVFDYNSKNDAAWILFMADKMDYTRDRFIESLIDEGAKPKFDYVVKSIELKRKCKTCNITFTLFEEVGSFLETAERITNVYTKTLNYFGFNKINFIVKVEN